jgi:hypothetical protein
MFIGGLNWETTEGIHSRSYPQIGDAALTWDRVPEGLLLTVR